MVNKHYNVQGLNKKLKQQNASPPPQNHISSIPIPNPKQQQQQQHQHHQSYEASKIRQSTDATSLQSNQASIGNDSAFGRNITYNNDDFDVIDHSDDNTSKIGGSSSLSSNDQHKDLSINDIGRFQYILQMDRELVSVQCITAKSTISPIESNWPNFHLAIAYLYKRGERTTAYTIQFGSNWFRKQFRID